MVEDEQGSWPLLHLSPVVDPGHIPKDPLPEIHSSAVVYVSNRHVVAPFVER